MGGVKMPMQKPIKMESNNLMIWTLSIPFIHPNCMPNVSLNNEIFILGTSIEQSRELSNICVGGAEGIPMSCAQFNFEQICKMILNWSQLLQDHGGSLVDKNDVKILELTLPFLVEL